MNDFLKGYHYCFDEFKKLRKLNPQMPLDKAIEEAEKRAKETFLAKPNVIVMKFDKKADCIVVDENKTEALHLQDVMMTLDGENNVPESPVANPIPSVIVNPFLLKEDSKEGRFIIKTANAKCKNLTSKQKILESMMFFQQCNPDGPHPDEKFFEEHADNLFVNVHQMLYIVEHTTEEILTDFCKASFGRAELPITEALITLAKEKKIISY